MGEAPTVESLQAEADGKQAAYALAQKRKSKEPAVTPGQVQGMFRCLPLAIPGAPTSIVAQWPTQLGMCFIIIVVALLTEFACRLQSAHGVHSTKSLYAW